MVEPLVDGLVNWPGWVGGFNYFDLGKRIYCETVPKGNRAYKSFFALQQSEGPRLVGLVGDRSWWRGPRL